MVDLQNKVGTFSLKNNSNQNQFENELSELVDLFGERMVNKETIEPLYFLFLNLSSENDVLRLAFINGGLIKKESGVLVEFFAMFFEKGFVFPEHPSAIKALVKICDKNLDSIFIEHLLGSLILSKLNFIQLHQLPGFCIPNLKAFIQIHFKFKEFDLKIDLIFNLLKRLNPNQVDEKTPDDLFEFLELILPEFEKKFADKMTTEVLHSNIVQIISWYQVWRNHHRQLEENLSVDAEYYNTDFTTIVKYITDYFWWNNGLQYGKGKKEFAFSSSGFYFLAIGGSIRKAPNQHPFTRRMAREFVELPYDLNLGERADLYIYLYVKSLGGGENLSVLLMEFINHPDHKIHLQEELDKWNPVIQKLASEEFEILEIEVAREFIGYLYHCLRDQPNFTVQRRSIQDLKLESDHYYDRILHRNRVRQRREEARRRMVESQQKILSWGPHRLIKPRTINSNKKMSVAHKFQIIELKNEVELQTEGRMLKHCVGSYSHRCKNGNCSIWSFRRMIDGSFRRMVTIEISSNKRIIQMRGRMNCTPSSEDKKAILDWAARENISV